MILPPVLFQWLKRIHAPELFLIPGAVLAGLALAGWNGMDFSVVLLCISAVLVRLFSENEFTGKIYAFLRPVMLVSACTVPLLLHCFTGILILAGIFILLGFLRNNRNLHPGCAVAQGLLGVGDVFLGVTALFPVSKNSLIFCSVFATGLFLYLAGTAWAESNRSARLAKCPGGTTVFTGALLCYLTLFARLGMVRLSGWISYLPGAFSALTAAVFLILSWKAFRTFRRPALPGIVHGWILALKFNVLFLFAAAVSVTGCWGTGLILLFFAFCSRALYVKLYGGDDGRLD